MKVLTAASFVGDDRLQAAANFDHAHVVPGSRGGHVRKIQEALVAVDGARIDAREMELGFYGPSTARAVLRFKTSHGIVNKSYQSKPDDITGKMTMAALDEALRKRERAASGTTRLEALTSRRALSGIGAPALTPGGLPVQRLGVNNRAPAAFDKGAIDIRLFGTGSFQVVDGAGGTVNCDGRVAILSDPTNSLSVGTSLPVTRSPQVFHVRGLQEGMTMVTFFRPFALSALTLPLVVIVQPSRRVQRVFVRGIEHNHAPSGRWQEVSAAPNNLATGVSDGGIFDATVMAGICMGCKSPKCTVDKIVALGFGSLPVAKSHIDWYLRVGNGRDFVEDGNILDWIRTDSGIRRTLRDELEGLNNRTGIQSGHFEFTQSDYGNDDFKNAFGGIDRVDFEFDFQRDQCTVWFQDRYEWHPVYPGLYELKEGDDRRSTNCAHAAFVEMKLEGAKDYWMKGEATVPLPLILT
ncbi:MAG: peptidoglycan-binding protein [Bryobacterales bacterium]|nr:peptidoglycan-binding protein [Bryobacterales bacterium]